MNAAVPALTLTASGLMPQLTKDENGGFAHQGRTASCPTAPSQIPACGIPAPGFSTSLASHKCFTTVLRKDDICVALLKGSL